MWRGTRSSLQRANNSATEGNGARLFRLIPFCPDENTMADGVAVALYCVPRPGKREGRDYREWAPSIDLAGSASCCDAPVSFSCKESGARRPGEPTRLGTLSTAIAARACRQYSTSICGDRFPRSSLGHGADDFEVARNTRHWGSSAKSAADK